MTRDEEVLQKFEEKATVVLGKAQQYLTTALPGGVGAVAYIVMSNLIGKLFGHTRQYVEKAINRPVTLPDFIYIEPLDEELEEFFDNARLQSLRAEFPARYEDFSEQHWATMRQYYMPLYYTLVVKEPFVSEIFASEIQTQNYKRIIKDFSLFTLYKQAMQTLPSASKQNAFWGAVTGVMKDTVKDVWSKEYAKSLFEEARKDPEVSNLIEQVKTKVGEKVNLEKLTGLKDMVKSLTGRALKNPEQRPPELPMKALECTAEILSGGKLRVPAEVTQILHLRPGTNVRLIVLCEE